jgi:hypothetical protein
MTDEGFLEHWPRFSQDEMNLVIKMKPIRPINQSTKKLELDMNSFGE